jgi:phage regulator Rha-like protein
MVESAENKETVDIVSQPSAEDIKGLILTIRGKQVLLDSDVARLYGYETKYINQAAKRNVARFPERYRFQLTLGETEQIRSKSQFVTLNTGRGTNIKKLPFAYTEQGVSMLAGLLRSDVAVQVSLRIIDAFVEMRQFISANRDVFANIASINQRLLEHDGKFLEQGAKIDEVLDLLNSPEMAKQSVFYKGQFYDAFKLVIEIIGKATKSITIIDNYADDSVLDMLTCKKAGVSVAIVTSNPNKLSQQHLAKFTAQYGQAQVVQCMDFHDRFIILDSKDVYAFGASIKDLGNKCFGIWKMEDTAAQFVAYVGQRTGVHCN